MYNNQCEVPTLGNPGSPASAIDPRRASSSGNEWDHLWLNPALKHFFTDYQEVTETGVCGYTLKYPSELSELHYILNYIWVTCTRLKGAIYMVTLSQNLQLYNSEWWFVTKSGSTPFSPVLNTDKGSEEVCFLLSFSSLIIQSYIILEQNLANSNLFPVPKKNHAVRNAS